MDRTQKKLIAAMVLNIVAVVISITAMIIKIFL